VKTDTIDQAPAPKGDPLLSSARAIIAIIQVFAALGFVLVLITIGAVLTVRRPIVLAKIAAAGGSPWAYPAMLFGLLLLLALLYLTRRFLNELKGIVDSVRAGDPFAEVNAARLQRMGWTTVTMLALGTVFSILVDVFARYAQALGLHERNGHGFLSGVLLALVLFILARVFRAGHGLRDDLEGTV